MLHLQLRLQLPLHCTTLHYTNYNTLQLQLHYFTLHQTTLHYTTLQHTTLQHTTIHYNTIHHNTLQYITLRTPHHNYNCNFSCNYATVITNYITLELRLTTTTPLRYITTTTTTALHHTTSNSCGEVTTATIAATPKTQLQPSFGPSVDLLCHPWFTTANLSSRPPNFETSAAALCGTTGILKDYLPLADGMPGWIIKVIVSFAPCLTVVEAFMFQCGV